MKNFLLTFLNKNGVTKAQAKFIVFATLALTTSLITSAAYFWIDSGVTNEIQLWRSVMMLLALFVLVPFTYVAFAEMATIATSVALAVVLFRAAEVIVSWVMVASLVSFLMVHLWKSIENFYKEGTEKNAHS